MKDAAMPRNNVPCDQQMKRKFAGSLETNFPWYPFWLGIYNILIFKRKLTDIVSIEVIWKHWPHWPESWIANVVFSHALSTFQWENYDKHWYTSFVGTIDKVWHFMVSKLEVPNFQTKDVWFNKLWMDEAGFPRTAGTNSRLEPPAQDMFLTRSHRLDANWIISMRRQLSPPLEQMYQLATPCWLKTLVGDRNDQCFQLLGGPL